MKSGRQNIHRILDHAEPWEQSEAKASYWKYNRLMAELARQTDTTLRIACAVFAALSPNNDYHGNLRDAYNLLKARQQGKTLCEFTVSTYGQNKLKAWEITHGTDPLDLIRAPKTCNFFQNISDPSDPVPVTVDGHVFNIWNGRRQNLVGIRGLTSVYERIADDVRHVALERDLIANQVQAIIWTTWRRMHHIQSTRQLSMWDEDFLAARLGFHRPL